MVNEEHELSHPHGPKSGHVTNAILSDDEGHAGDIEEGMGREGQRSKKGKERRSWTLPSALSLGHGSQSTSDTATATAPADQPYHSHTYPPTTPLLDLGNGDRSGRAMPQPRRYHEEDTAVVQAAKVLKTAVMHDARNIKGKEDGPSGLSWNINSAHEAKVQLLQFRSHCKTAYTYSQAPG